MFFIRWIFLLCLLLCFSTSALSQDSLTYSVPKSSIGINAGTLLVYFNLMGHYEHHLKTFETNKLTSHLYLHAGYGVYASWGANGQVMEASAKWILGKRRAFLETGLGVAGLYDAYYFRVHRQDKTYLQEGRSSPRGRLYFIDWFPAFKFAFRYQNPEKRNIYRVGIGSPDGFFLSLSRAIR